MSVHSSKIHDNMENTANLPESHACSSLLSCSASFEVSSCTWKGEAPQSATAFALSTLPSPTRATLRALPPTRADSELPCTHSDALIACMLAEL